MLCGLFVCFFHQQLVLTKQANALKKKKKASLGIIAVISPGGGYTVNSSIQTS